MKHLRFP